MKYYPLLRFSASSLLIFYAAASWWAVCSSAFVVRPAATSSTAPRKKTTPCLALHQQHPIVPNTAAAAAAAANKKGGRWGDSGRWENAVSNESYILQEKYGTYFKVPSPASLMTRIICTIGPQTDDATAIGRMLDAGMSAARVNMSHGSHGSASRIIDTVRAVSKARNKPCPIILDTKGPEIRVNWILAAAAAAEGKDQRQDDDSAALQLASGDPFTLLTGEYAATKTPPTATETSSSSNIANDRAAAAAVSYPYLSQTVQTGDVILLDDGRISLMVTSVASDDEVRTQVIEGGKLVPNKGVNLPGCHVELPHLTAKDEEDIRFGVSKRVEFIAHSFTRSPTGINQVREIPGIVENGTHIIAKIESQEGLDNFAAILAVSDGVMVARGDLGVEIPLERVCSVQKRLVASCNAAGKPVIVATELLDSMIHHPRPTRAEATDVANAVFDGADCVMLSGETAVGAYPIEAIQVMTRICKEAELDVASSLRAMAAADGGGSVINGSANGGGDVIHARWVNGGGGGGSSSLSGATSHASERSKLRDAFAKSAIMTARETGAELIVAITRTGLTAHALAKFFSQVPVMVLSTSSNVCSQVSLHRSVTPYRVGSLQRESCVPRAIAKATELGLVGPGSRVLLLTGDDGLAANRLETFVVGEGMHTESMGASQHTTTVGNATLAETS